MNLSFQIRDFSNETSASLSVSMKSVRIRWSDGEEQQALCRSKASEDALITTAILLFTQILDLSPQKSGKTSGWFGTARPAYLAGFVELLLHPGDGHL